MDLLPEAQTGVIIFVNGREVGMRLIFVFDLLKAGYFRMLQIRVSNPDPEMTLLYFLRKEREYVLLRQSYIYIYYVLANFSFFPLHIVMFYILDNSYILFRWYQN